MENFIAYNPTKVHFGKNAVDKLGEEAAGLGKNALLVYGKGSALKNGSHRDTLSQLQSAGIQTTQFSGIKSNPTVGNVDDATSLGLDRGVDIVVGVGGGSVIDAAKMIAVCISEKCKAWEVMNGEKEPGRVLPVIAVLTLAATGTEMNNVAVLQNDETKEKFGYRHPLMFPAHSFMDPAYTFSVPAIYTAYGIVDLVAHAIESFFGAGDASLSDRFVASIVQEAILYGPQLMENLGDYLLRARIMWAATNAINGLTSYGRSNGDWASHAIGHQLSVLYDTPHGASLSIALPAWMKHMKSRTCERISCLGMHIFDDPDPDRCISDLENFFHKLGSPVRCQEIGLGISEKKEITGLANKNNSNSKNPDHRLDDQDRLRIVEYMFAE